MNQIVLARRVRVAQGLRTNAEQRRDPLGVLLAEEREAEALREYLTALLRRGGLRPGVHR